MVAAAAAVVHADPCAGGPGVFFVDQNHSTGCSDGFPGSEAQPWCTIQKAAQTLVAGETVCVKEGTYSAFSELAYQVIRQWELPAQGNGDIHNWWNGLYVAVIHKAGVGQN